MLYNRAKSIPFMPHIPKNVFFAVAVCLCYCTTHENLVPHVRPAWEILIGITQNEYTMEYINIMFKLSIPKGRKKINIKKSYLIWHSYLTAGALPQKYEKELDAFGFFLFIISFTTLMWLCSHTKGNVRCLKGNWITSTLYAPVTAQTHTHWELSSASSKALGTNCCSKPGFTFQQSPCNHTNHVISIPIMISASFLCGFEVSKLIKYGFYGTLHELP